MTAINPNMPGPKLPNIGNKYKAEKTDGAQEKAAESTTIRPKPEGTTQYTKVVIWGHYSGAGSEEKILSEYEINDGKNETRYCELELGWDVTYDENGNLVSQTEQPTKPEG